MLTDIKKKFYEQFLPLFNSFQEEIRNNPEVIDKSLKKTYISALSVLVEYLKIMGVYPSNSLAAIKSAFYNEIIKDGYTWIELYYWNKGINKIENDIFINDKKYTAIFTDLSNYIEQELTKYDLQKK